ncbi:hypothetical protein HELRODRAFT_180148 [Helobdella robusta]|uniref:Uncharacterized protein n=1 Tax=Helobdella robusta TaxID=6412 RepID=T1FFI8_HELRO|nr:hypothetical protein HELRODRAFT_180148 [Helobdella robusta]ESN94802.1 hypothetical protein HELRODRAFT_180148 [Helobdella robusta]
MSREVIVSVAHQLKQTWRRPFIETPNANASPCITYSHFQFSLKYRQARRTFRLSRDSSVACRIRFKITQLNYCNQETQIEVSRPIGKNISLLQGLRTHSVARGIISGVPRAFEAWAEIFDAFHK